MSESYMNVAERLGKRMKMIRFSSGAKQKDVASELGIPAPLLSMYEKGTREPPLSFLEKYCSYFGLPLSNLFALLDEPSKNDSPKVSALMKEMKSLLLNLEAGILKNKNKG
jgi:transcriptional regulator with XRE-family HTH domain